MEYFFNQEKYTKEMIKIFGYDKSKIAKTPMSTSAKLDKDESCIKVSEKLYRGMFGSLLYLTSSRPDIMFSVCLCAHFQTCPKQSPRFKDNQNPNHVYLLNKALYGLKQAPRAWYEILSSFILENEFVRRKFDTTLF